MKLGARVKGRQQWEGVFQNAAGGIQVIRPSRGQGVIQEVWGAHRPTMWGSDLDRAHKKPPAEDGQGCLAPQVRDGQVARDAGDTVCAPRLTAVLLRALASHKRHDPLAASTLSQYRGELQRRVQRGLARQPTNPHGRRLQKRSAKLQDNLFLVLDDATIPPTKTSSEQAIRMSTVFRKGTNGVRSDGGRDLCAAVRAVVNTGKRRGLSAFQAIQKARSPLGSLFDPG